MTNKTTKKGGASITELAIIGASIAGAAATAYFFFGPKGKANRKHAKAWAIKMKADVIEKLEKAKEVSEKVYHEIIDTVAEKYKKGKKISAEEIDELAKDLKKHWKTISASVKPVTKKKVVAKKK